jgi:uncharacterized protein YbbC (DUF1343 family)
VGQVATGLDVVVRDGHPLLRGKRAGLLMNQASIDCRGRYAHDALAEAGVCEIAALFGPQHGLWGTTQDNMIEWEGYRDERTKLPVYSLYGTHRKPPQAWLEGLEVMIIDLQDIGARYYTFVWTACYMLEACAAQGLPVVVLDRPNPINGLDLEGPDHHADYTSFVGLYSLPVRHGLTMAELLVYVNATHKLGCELQVVRLEGWQRGMWFDDTGLPWSMPSPNMPTLDTATVYPGGCLIEGTMLSEGRGTTRPFEIVGAPYVKAYELAAALEAEPLPGVCFRPLEFEPTFQKHARQVCGGVFVHVTDRSVFRSVRTYLVMLHHIVGLYGDAFAFKAPPYEYETVKRPFDILAGSSRISELLASGAHPLLWLDALSTSEQTFAAERRDYLLYGA